MFQNCLISGGCIQGDKNFLVHNLKGFSARCEYSHCVMDRPRQTIYVKRGDEQAGGPAGDGEEAPVAIRSHELPGTSEPEERKHGEWQLDGEDHLAEV